MSKLTFEKSKALRYISASQIKPKEGSCDGVINCSTKINTRFWFQVENSARFVLEKML